MKYSHQGSFPSPKCFACLIKSNQAARTCRVNGHAGTCEIEEGAEPVGQKRSGKPSRGIFGNYFRILCIEHHVIRSKVPRKHSSICAVDPTERYASCYLLDAPSKTCERLAVLKSLVRGLEKPTLLRVHGRCLISIDGEKGRIKRCDVGLQKMGLFGSKL